MLLVILLCLFSPLHMALAGEVDDDSEISFANILSLTCEVSTFVSRSKRSIELPDIFNAKETFDYLFPLANVQPEDFSPGGGRSDSPPALSWWLEDAVDLWHHECGERRAKKIKKRRVKRRSKKYIRKRRENANSESNRMNPDDVITWAGYLGNISSMYFPPPVEVGDEEYAEESKYETIVEEAADHEEEDNDSDKYEEEEDAEEDEEVDDTTTTTTEKSKKEEETTAAPVASTAAPPEPDPYFASYGGDIEYFFPILSFTIPFDGEITLLGFHGFKGMFLY